MSAFKCVFCSSVLQTVEYNLKLTKSLHSEVFLIQFVKDFVEDLNLSHFNICTKCYNILNELDYLIARQTEIYKELKEYIFKTTVSCDVSKSSDKIFTENLKHNIGTSFISDDNYSEVVLPKDELSDELIDDNVSIKSEGHTKNDINEYDESVTYAVKKRRGRKKLDPSKKVNKCHCSKVFSKKSDLEKHLLSHSNHGPHVCDICGQSYKNKYAFKIHLDMHNGINAYTCTYCQKSFTQKGALNRHIHIHTGDRTYQCDLCGKTFIHHTSFTMHKLAHTGTRTSKCDICGLALISGSHLKRHMRVHTGEKKFSCSTCGKRFAERYNLVAHEKLHDKTVVRKKKCGGGVSLSKKNFL